MPASEEGSLRKCRNMLQFCALLLLLLAVPRCGAAGQQRGRPSSLDTPKALRGSSDADLVPPTVITPQECPGVDGRNCTRQCQLRICEALADLYRVSSNAFWDHEAGWVDTATQSCAQLVAAQHAQHAQPVYCTWHGVSCCDNKRAAARRCHLVGSVSGLSLAVNNLNTSTHLLLRPLKALHDCGLFELDLQVNSIAGSLSEEWGQLRYLQRLNLGTCWINGTIPSSLKQLHKLTLLNLGNNWLVGTLPEWLPELQMLQVLNLGSQFGAHQGSNGTGLQGTIPGRIGELRHLRELVLEGNSLSGQLPAGLCNADNSSLLVLNLRDNGLEGSAKAVEQCGSLVQLDLSHNSFTGSLPASKSWEELATYTASFNGFTGTFPKDLVEARILEYLDVSHNQLSGLIPPKVTLMSSLKSVKLSHNRLSGTVVEDLYYMPAISVLDLSNNQFLGTTPVAIGTSYSLAELDLSNNPGITGMLPPQLGLLKSVKLVKYTATNLSCAGITQPYVVTTNVSCTDPDVCTTPKLIGDPSARLSKCDKEQLLPCFLTFSEYMLPRDDDSNMRCKVILRKPTQQAQRDCRAGAGPQQLGAQAADIPDVSTDRTMARWEVDPAYYQFQACECLLGFSPVWSEAGTVLTCVPEQRNSQQTGITIAATISSVAVLLVGILAWRQYLHTQPRWLRERRLQAKRLQGAPKAKPGERVLVSIVVTDVQDFSDLTRRYPEVMSKAMGTHNNIMRKACHAHAGHVLDQEGDSWTMAFHDTEDAVAFSLQVQQALAGKVWSPKLAVSPDGIKPQSSSYSFASGSFSLAEPSSEPPPAAGAASQLQEHACASTGSGVFSTGPHSLPNGCAASGAAYGVQCSNGVAVSNHLQSNGSYTAPDAVHVGVGMAAAGNTAVNGHAQLQLQQAGPLSNSHTPRVSTTGQLQGEESLQQLCRDADKHPQHVDQSAQPPSGSLRVNSSSMLKSLWESLWSGQRGDTHNLSFSAASQHAGSSRAVSMSHGSQLMARLHLAGSAAMQQLARAVRGNSDDSLLPVQRLDLERGEQLRLAVRIGIATGWLQYGRSLDNSSIKGKAKELLSDAANGGQVLMDEQTFKHIQPSLAALGCIDGSGYTDKQLALQHVGLMRCVPCGSGCSTSGSRTSKGCCSKQPPRSRDAQALVIHMGSFSVPTAALSSHMHGGKAAYADLTTTTHDDSTTTADDEDEREERPSLPPAAAAAGRKAGTGAQRPSRKRPQQTDGAGHSSVMHVQLYSIAAPSMRRVAANAQELPAWCRPVNTKPGWVQVDKSFLQAPGAHPSALALTIQQEPRPLMPVTLVCADVPHALSFVGSKQHAGQLQALDRAISHCMQRLLGSLPDGDGYMCHCCEAEPQLRYMVAFTSPVRAAQWCMLLQEALMYLGWPESLLCLPGFEEVVEAGSGQLLFRGPRLRMGLAAGPPSSVLPDHTGRAAYKGPAVKRAAAIMEAVKQPGHVVCDLQLAQHILHTWPQHASMPRHGRCSWGNGLCSASPVAGAAAAALASATGFGPVSHQASAGAATGAEWEGPQATLQQLMARRSLSETSGHCRPATGSQQGLRGRAVGAPMLQQQPAAPGCSRAGAAWEPVRAGSIGIFSLKGSGSVELVQLQHAALSGRQFAQEASAASAKGMRALSATGLCADLPSVQLHIPASLTETRKAFLSGRDVSTVGGV